MQGGATAIQSLVIPITAFDALPFGITIIDRSGVIEYFNPEMLKMAGAKKASQIVGINAFTFSNYVEAGLSKRFRDSFRTGKPFRIDSLTYVSYTGKKKTVRHYSGIPIADEHGTVQKLFCMVEDITEQEQIRQKLMEQSIEFEVVFKALPDLYFRLDETGTILDYRAGKRSDLYAPPEQFLGKKVSDILPPTVVRGILNGVAQALETKKLVTIEYSLTMHKKEQTYEARLFPIFKQQVVAVVRNVSDRKEAELKLQEYVGQLELMTRNMMGRELRMEELKAEIAALKAAKKV